MDHLLGVDGGGTRTTLALGNDVGEELARREGPPGIVDPGRPSASVAVVEQMIRSLLQDAAVQPPVSAMCVGLAGVSEPAIRNAVHRQLGESGLARRVIVCSDAEVAFAGALGGGAGILLASGTGSVAWGRGEDGRVARCGGWGAVAGDEGSAYWLGREALRAVMQAHDGRGAATILWEQLPTATHIEGPEALPGWALRAGKRDIAGLAPLVVAAAEGGDEVAVRLVGAAADELMRYAAALETRLAPWSGEVPIILHGGLATTPTMIQAVADRVKRLGRMTLSAPLADAVTGALDIARRFVSEPRHDGDHQRHRREDTTPDG